MRIKQAELIELARKNQLATDGFKQKLRLAQIVLSFQLIRKYSLISTETDRLLSSISTGGTCARC